MSNSRVRPRRGAHIRRGTAQGLHLGLAMLACSFALGSLGASAEEADTNVAEPDRLPTAPVEANSRAEHILSGLVEGLTDSNASLDGRPDFSVGSPISASDAGESVVVTFPRAKAEHDDGARTYFGDITLDITPVDGLSYDFSVDWPRTIEMRDDQGRLTELVTVDEFGFEGRWHAELETLTQAKGLFRDIALTTIEAGQEKGGANIGSITIDQVYEQGENGLWSGPYSLEVADITILPEGLRRFEGLEGFDALPEMSPENASGGPEAVHIAGISVTGSMTDVDLGAWQTLSEAFEAALAAPEAAPSDTETAPNLAEIIKTLTLGSVQAAFRLKGIDLLEDGQPTSALKELTLNVGLDAREAPETLTFGLSATGFDTTEFELEPEYRPQHIALDLALERFPLRAIFALAAEDMPPMPADDAPLTLDQPPIDEEAVMALLVDSGTEISFLNIAVETSVAEISGKGGLAVDPLALLGVSGRFNATIVGLDRLIEVTSESSDPDAADTLGLLTMVKGLGRPEAGPDDTFTYAYDIEIPPNGVVTVNGTPLDFLEQQQEAHLTAGAPEAR